MAYYLDLMISHAYLAGIILAGIIVAFIVKADDRKARIKNGFVAMVICTAALFAMGVMSGKLAPMGQDTMRLISLNANKASDDVTDKVSLALNNGAHIVGFVEARKDFYNLMSYKARNILHKTYPHATYTPLEYPLSEPEGMILLSKFPFKMVKVIDHQAVIYKVRGPKSDFYLVQAHALAPTNTERLERRNKLLKTLASLKVNLPIVMMGDFNTAPWQAPLTDIVTAQQLKFTQKWKPTWPVILPIIPLDFVLASEGFEVMNAIHQKVSGAEHLAVIADLKQN